MTSQFHDVALRMLSRSYVPDPRALAALKRREEELGTRLPASFVEWYGMRDGIALLRKCSNTDDPIEIAELGSPLAWRWNAPRDCVREGLLPFMVENQACCLWAVSLDGSDDPPVMVARDPELDWRRCTQGFSSFIDCQAWDHTAVFGLGALKRVLLSAQDHPLRTSTLEFLRGRFTERTTTRGWPGDYQYRFESPRGCLLLWDSPDQADWWIASDSDDDLAALIREIWHLGQLRSSLYSNSDRGRRVLERIRA